MKKSLLFAAALVCAATVNAQVFQMDGEAFGLSSEAADVEAGLVWGEAGSVTLSNAFATQHKLVDCKNNNYNQVLFNGADVIVTKNGVQGQDNPKDIDGGNPGITLVAPATGAVVALEAAADGYVYIVAKLSSNKNYYVFEEGTAVGFTLAMQVASEAFPEGIIKYTAEGEGEFNEITNPALTDWPEKVALGEGWEAAAGEAGKIGVNGLGVIGFPVFEGCKYLVGAGGSKISWSGAYFCAAPVSVVLQGTDSENPVEDFVLIAGEDQPGEPGEEPVEVEPIVLWEGEAVCDNWGDQPNLLSDGGAELIEAGAKAGDVLRFYITPMESENGFFYIEIVEGHWATTYANYSNEEGAEGRTYTDLADGYVTLELTEDILATVTAGPQGWGGTFIGNGDKTIITKIELVPSTGSAISNVKAESNATVIFNVAGQKMNAAKGLSIVNGKVIMVK